MSTSFAWIRERRLLAFLVSILIITISLFGPPNVPVYKYFIELDIQGLIEIAKTHESVFKTPSTMSRILLLILGLLLLLSITKIKLRKKYNLKYLHSLAILFSSLFFLTILTTENFYNFSAILLILSSILYYLYAKNDDLVLNEKLYISSLFLMAIFPLLHTFIYPSQLSEVDNYLRFILVIPIFLIFRKIKFSELNLLIIITSTSILIGLISIYFLFSSTQINIKAFTSTPKIFGNISLLFAVLSLIGSFYVYQFHKRLSLISLVGFLMAFYAWGLSGTRSSLLLIFSFLLIIILFRRKFMHHIQFSINSIIAVGIIAFLLLFQSGLTHRLYNAYHSTYNYITEDSIHHWKHKDSIVPRLNIWNGSLNMINDNLLFGVGLSNYNKSLENEIKKGNISPIRNDPQNLTAGMNHAHSQYLDIFAKTGIIGFSILLFFLVMNVMIFTQSLKSKNFNIPATMGLCSTFAYIIFMLFHTVSSHQQSVLFMTILLSALAGMSTMHTKRDDL